MATCAMCILDRVSRALEIARLGATGPGAVFGAQIGAVRGWAGGTVVTMHTIPAELGPLNWRTGRAYAHDADFDSPTTLEQGEEVILRCEDGSLYRAKVMGVETGRLGRTWTLRLVE